MKSPNRPLRLALLWAVSLALTACATSAGGAGASGPAGFARTTLNGRPCVVIPPDKIGIQLWAVQRLFNIPAGTGLAATASADAVDAGLAQVAALGYRKVEIYSTYGLPAAQFRAILAKHGMSAVASHSAVREENWDATMDYALAMGQTYIGSSLPPVPGVNTLADTLQLAKNVNELGRRAAARGLKLYLHNHTMEFDNRYLYDINKDGRPVMTTAWEIVAAETDPRYVNFEIDVNWAFRGLQSMGQDQAGLAAFMRKHSDRIILLHIKEPNALPPPDRGEVDVGTGNIDWPAIYAAAPKAELYIYEYDNPPNPLRSAEIAYKYLSCKA